MTMERMKIHIRLGILIGAVFFILLMLGTITAAWAQDEDENPERWEKYEILTGSLVGEHSRIDIYHPEDGYHATVSARFKFTNWHSKNIDYQDCQRLTPFNTVDEVECEQCASFDVFVEPYDGKNLQMPLQFYDSVIEYHSSDKNFKGKFDLFRCTGNLHIYYKTGRYEISFYIESADRDEYGPYYRDIFGGEGKLPQKGNSIVGETLANYTPDDEIQKLSWRIEAEPSEEIEVKVRNQTRDSSHCACDKDGQVTLSATATKKGKGPATKGKFEKFIVEPTGKMPEVVKNEGGKTPTLILKGKGQEHGMVRITAVYKEDKDTYKSDPYELSFCDIEKPKLLEGTNPHTLGNDSVFVFTSDAPGTLEFTAETRVWMDGQELANDDVEIDMDRNPEDLFKRERPESEKPKMKFKADRMPFSNDTFGERKIIARPKKASCDCEEEVKTTIFFPRDEFNNPQEQEPNWSYYWKQTSAGKMPSGIPYNYKVVPAIPPFNKKLCAYVSCFFNCGDVPADPRGIAEYDNFEDIIYIPDALPLMSCAPRQPGAKEETGIDCYANTVRHETQHRINTISWWGPKMARYKCLDDLDGDSVPNDIEDSTPGCDKLDFSSCPNRPKWLGDLGDMEFGSYQAGWTWQIGSADKEDWAYPGKQLQ